MLDGTRFLDIPVHILPHVRINISRTDRGRLYYSVDFRDPDDEKKWFRVPDWSTRDWRLTLLFAMDMNDDVYERIAWMDEYQRSLRDVLLGEDDPDAP